MHQGGEGLCENGRSCSKDAPLEFSKRSAHNKRGYPHWDDHPAKKLMESDVANGLHKNYKSASEFRDTRPKYKPFPVEIIAKRVNDEVRRQKAEGFWAHRSKVSMKNHVK